MFDVLLCVSHVANIRHPKVSDVPSCPG
jgi:hypothetical protein